MIAEQFGSGNDGPDPSPLDTGLGGLAELELLPASEGAPLTSALATKCPESVIGGHSSGSLGLTGSNPQADNRNRAPSRNNRGLADFGFPLHLSCLLPRKDTKPASRLKPASRPKIEQTTTVDYESPSRALGTLPAPEPPFQEKLRPAPWRGFSLSAGGVPSADAPEGELTCRSGGLSRSIRTITTGRRARTQAL